MKRFVPRYSYGMYTYGLLLVLPLVFWLSATGLSTHVAYLSSFLKMIAKGAALSSFVAYCLEPVLSMRFSLVEKLFGGLDKVYALHKKSGKLAFYLMTAHFVFLLGYGFASGKSFSRFWNWASPTVVIGLVAFVAIAALVAFSLYAHIKHQRWVIVHRLFGWLLPVLLLHTLLANAQVTHVMPLYIYMLLIAEVGFVSFIWRSVLTIFIHRYRYVVAEVTHVTPLITELVLKPTGIPMSYTPGQFAYLSLISPGIDREAHPYSFTTGNNGPYIRFVIKTLGDDTAHIKDVKPGSLALLEGPHGRFSLHNSKNPRQVWIAGGVGITPFLSMARSLRPGDKHRIHLFYGADKLDDAVFMKELIAIRKMLPDTFDFTLVNREWSGFVTADVVGKAIGDFTATDYFICGPPVMMKTLKKGLIAKGVTPEQLYTEEFSVL